MSTLATPATPRCSNAFEAEDGPLRIRDLELSELVKRYSSQAAFNTPEHMKISVTRATNILHKFTQGATELKIAGMEFQTASKGYVLLEGHDRDKNYANLQRPLLGKFKEFDNFLPDHWQSDFVVKFKKAADKKAMEVTKKLANVINMTLTVQPWPTEVEQTLDGSGYQIRYIYRGPQADVGAAETAFSAARLNLDDAFKDHPFTIENETTRFISADAPKKLIGRYTEEEILGVLPPPPAPRTMSRLASAFRAAGHVSIGTTTSSSSAPSVPKLGLGGPAGGTDDWKPKPRKRERSENSHVADLPESKKLPPRISFAPSELQRYIRPKPLSPLPSSALPSREDFVPSYGMPSYPGPSSITAPSKLASSPTPAAAVEVDKDIEK